MLTIPASMRTQATLCRTQAQALCWKITRTDAIIYRFTDWPHALQLKEADSSTVYTYTPVDGLDSSARRRVDELESTNKEMRGLISSDAIETADLRAGRFDGAQIDEFLVDAKMPWSGYIEHARYFVKTVAYSRGIWNAEVDGLAGYLNTPNGDVWTPTCRVNLFSTECGLLESAFGNASASVSVVVTQRQVIRLAFTTVGVLGAWATLGYANDGILIWRSGLNNGLRTEIKSHEAIGISYTTGGLITFHAPTPYDIAAGDIGTILPGCNKKAGVPLSHFSTSLVGHCKTRFNNLINFQGEPYIPGRDRAVVGIPIR